MAPMNAIVRFSLIVVGLLGGVLCQSVAYGQPGPKALSTEQQAAAQRANVPKDLLTPLLNKPLHEFSEAEVDLYLQYLQALEPDLRRRIVHLARKNIGQPYELYLLGEMPFEHYDPQPIYCLGKSD
ncbi:MAG: hypothetical protein ACR2NM_12140, partial [Bythopirellula sp.]